MKRRKQVDTANNSTTFAYSVAGEICEEDSDNNNQLKPKPFILLQALYSVLTGKIANTLERITAFHDPLSNTLTDRYLVFQVFRI